LICNLSELKLKEFKMNYLKKRYGLLFMAIFIMPGYPLFTGIMLPSVFPDNMVLQQNSEVAIRGWENAGEQVKNVAGWKSSDTLKVQTDNTAKWKTTLKTDAASGPYTLQIFGSSTIELKNVMLGEVRVFSGQSNMEWSVNMGIQNGEEEVPNTGMVVVSDLVDNINDIHPRNKKDVGKRLANFALAETNNREVGAYRSPAYESMQLENNKIRLNFENVLTGLKSIGNAPSQFLIAGSDDIFVPAMAKIEGSTIIVSAKEVNNPVAGRFCFDNTSLPDVFSNEGLPLAPFRTDR
jgi:hypothetical protein